MSLLGCNSVTIWHEIFNQIVDIISVKQEKIDLYYAKLSFNSFRIIGYFLQLYSTLQSFTSKCIY